MNVFALTFGDETCASTYFRLLQYHDFFEEAGIRFAYSPAKEFNDYAALERHDLIILQKPLLSRSCVRAIKKHARRLIYDIDDLIWISPHKRNSWLTRFRNELRLRAIVRTAETCLVPNQVIAAELRHRRGHTTIVPMALDDRKWTRLQRPARAAMDVTIGWSGSPKNVAFVRTILPSLLRVQDAFPEVTWTFHSGVGPELPGLRFTHIPYRPGEEPAAVSQFDIGLLPLTDDPFSRGKSPIKALQYFACGCTVVSSPVGATTEIVEPNVTGLWADNPEAWTVALGRLISNQSLRASIGLRAREAFESRYASQVVFRQLLAVLKPGGPRSEEPTASAAGKQHHVS